MRRRLLFALLIVPRAAFGQEPDGESAARARAAVESGEILPLEGILAEVETRYQGRVIATVLDRHEGRWVYRFKLLPATGRIIRLCVDAASGNVIAIQGAVDGQR